jgi:hypothetical protein
MQKWFDEDLHELPFTNSSPIHKRFAWWECMVKRLIETVGYVSLT